MIDVSTGVSFGALALAVAAFGWLWLRFDKALSTERSEREELTADLSAFKLEAFRTFATPGAIEKAEERLAIALDRVTARLETAIERIEALSNNFIRLGTSMSDRPAKKPSRVGIVGGE
jgi:hypothetical protein